MTPPLGARGPAHGGEYHTPSLRFAVWHAFRQHKRGPRPSPVRPNHQRFTDPLSRGSGSQTQFSSVWFFRDRSPAQFGDRWERGEGRLAKPGAGLIQPLCRRDGRPGCQGEKTLGAQAPSHAGICQTGAVGKGKPSQHEASWQARGRLMDGMRS